MNSARGPYAARQHTVYHHVAPQFSVAFPPEQSGGRIETFACQQQFVRIAFSLSGIESGRTGDNELSSHATVSRLNERENGGADGLGQVVPGGYDAGQFGGDNGARKGTRRARHLYEHLARWLVA